MKKSFLITFLIFTGLTGYAHADETILDKLIGNFDVIENRFDEDNRLSNTCETIISFKKSNLDLVLSVGSESIIIPGDALKEDGNTLRTTKHVMIGKDPHHLTITLSDDSIHVEMIETDEEDKTTFDRIEWKSKK